MGWRLRFYTGTFLFLSVFLNRITCDDQDGFLSLSCGGAEPFVDSLNITWTPDREYITTGNTTMITHNYTNGPTTLPSYSNLPVRFFPDTGSRNCYHLPSSSSSSSTILVRVQFMYNNYDQLSKPPAFSVSIGTAMAANVSLDRFDPWVEEFVYPVKQNNNNDDDVFPICFHSILNQGNPVISSIELRPLPEGAYTNEMNKDSNDHQLLRKRHRINCGFIPKSTRYPVDPYDRIWDPDAYFTPFKTSTIGMSNHLNFNSSSVMELPPMDVLQTARILSTTQEDTLTYDFPLEKLGDYYILLYFGRILPQSLSMNILINGKVFQYDYSINTSETSVLYFIQERTDRLNISFQSRTNLFYTQVNAIEVYEIIHLPPPTSSTTVSALHVIQQYAGLDLGWEDDPCSPLPWNHLGCELNIVTSLKLADMKLRSINPAFGDLLDLRTLDLHNTSLEGGLENLVSLSQLQSLYLQNNSLRGTVPHSWGALKHLQFLNLQNNKLQGPLPQSLNRGSLVIRTSGNLCLSFSVSTCDGQAGNKSIEEPQITMPGKRKKSRDKHAAIIIGVIGGGLTVILISILVFLYARMIKTTQDEDTSETGRMALDIKNWNTSARVFSFKDIRAATNKFKEVIGRGSFGSVYLGKLFDNGKLVAVKVRHDRTQLGLDSFINEVHLLSKIRHPNLVCLEGFCYEKKQQILVYEHLQGGSLADNLYGSNSKKFTLSWIRRLKIAVDAAKGLEYLHNGSEPRIIHRDVKCSNILLDSQMNAKVADFGLCKQVMRADATHVTTVVKGTAGYLDPEYYTSQQLTEKSDVYSFGVVLLELICGREPLTPTGNPNTVNLVLWAKPFLQAGVFEIVDESIKGTFDVESMTKTASLALRCVERNASLRPTIAETLKELKQAYSIQLAYLATAGWAS